MVAAQGLLENYRANVAVVLLPCHMQHSAECLKPCDLCPVPFTGLNGSIGITCSAATLILLAYMASLGS